MCSMPVVPPRVLGPDVSPDRERLIVTIGKKWLNGTKLRYFFMPSRSSIGGTAQKQLVRDGFARWRDIGIGITFEEVSSISASDIRIGFVEGDGSWSFIGRDIRSVPGPTERTMNFGWDLTQDPRKADVAVHEIGHTLGFPHEHQNPFAGIVWDEIETLRVFGGPPNNWNEATVRHNILRKLSTAEVTGTQWDPDSIMHYGFPAGVITAPQQYRGGLTPHGGLSPHDIAQAKLFYPPLNDTTNRELQQFRSQPLALAPGEQANFTILPTESREYKFLTFGGADLVMVLFEETSATDHQFVAGDDDSGVERNAQLVARLTAGRRYTLRIRMFANTEHSEFAVMLA
jgi:Astacin (Peptidase family M12A)